MYHVFSCRPGHDIVGKIHAKQIYEIAMMKLRDPHLSHLSEEAMAKCIAASALSMGLEIVRD
jgi:ribosomal protein L11